MRLLPQKDWFCSGVFQAIAWTVLSLYMLVQVAALLGAPLNKYDDSIPLVSADLILHGRTPGVDFWSFYPPLYYYLIVAGFKLFGRTFLVPRLLAIALDAVVVFAAARLFLASLPALRSLVAFMLFPLVVTMGVLKLPSWPGFALALLSMMAYLRSSRSRPPDIRWMAFAGVLGGLSTLVRFNFGPYAMLVVGADILVNEVLAATNEPAQLRLRRALIQASAFVIPFGLSNIIFYLWVYGASAVAVPWQMVRYSMGVMSAPAFLQVRHDGLTLVCLAFPCVWMCVRKILPADKLETSALICAAGGAILTGSALLAGTTPSVSLWFPAATLVSVIVLHLTVSPLPRAALALLLFYVCVQHYFLSRADFEHSVLCLPIVALTIPLLSSSPVGTDQERQGFAPKGQVFLVLVVATYFIMGLSYDLHQSISFAKRTLTMLKNGALDPRMPDRERLLFSDPSLLEEVQATEFVRQRTTPSEPIYVGVKDHSKSFVNSVRAYWLAERLPGSTHVNLDAPVGAGEPAQREIIAELQRNKVNWAILYDSSGTDEDYLFERTPPGSKALDEYFVSQFQDAARFGRYAVVTRRSPARAVEVSPGLR